MRHQALLSSKDKNKKIKQSDAILLVSSRANNWKLSYHDDIDIKWCNSKIKRVENSINLHFIEKNFIFNFVDYKRISKFS